MSRDHTTDALKGLAIFGVVFIHTAGGLGVAPAFRFCVPVFITLWALYTERSLARRPATGAWDYARSRLVALAIPFAFWTAIYVALLHQPSLSVLNDPQKTIAEWFGGYGWPGQYFFVVLFQLVMLAPLLRRAIGRHTMWLLLAAGLVGYPAAEFARRAGLLAKIDDRFVVYWLPYVALGIGLARGYVPRFPRWLLLLTAGLALALTFAEGDWITAVEGKISPYVLTTVYVASIALVLAAAPRESEPEAGKLLTVLAWVGRYTFPIFLTNYLLLVLVPGIVIESAGGEPLRSLAQALVALAVTLGGITIGWLLRQARLGVLVGG